MLDTKSLHVYHDKIFIPALKHLVLQPEELFSDVEYDVTECSCSQSPYGDCYPPITSGLLRRNVDSGIFIYDLLPGCEYTVKFSASCASSKKGVSRIFHTCKLAYSDTCDYLVNLHVVCAAWEPVRDLKQSDASIHSISLSWHYPYFSGAFHVSIGAFDEPKLHLSKSFFFSDFDFHSRDDSINFNSSLFARLPAGKTFNCTVVPTDEASRLSDYDFYRYRPYDYHETEVIPLVAPKFQQHSAVTIPCSTSGYVKDQLVHTFFILYKN